MLTHGSKSTEPILETQCDLVPLLQSTGITVYHMNLENCVLHTSDYSVLIVRVFKSYSVKLFFFHL